MFVLNPEDFAVSKRFLIPENSLYILHRLQQTNAGSSFTKTLGLKVMTNELIPIRYLLNLFYFTRS
jgi:hypothetical protein